MRAFRRTGILFLALLCVILSACGSAERSAEAVLTELMTISGALPEGEIYRSGAEEGSEAYLSPALARAMYGEDAEAEFALLADYAIYLSSFAAPAEIAVFHCYSSGDAGRVEAMCRNRLDQLRVALRDTEFLTLAEEARIVKQGRWVVVVMVEEAEAVSRDALRLVR